MIKDRCSIVDAQGQMAATTRAHEGIYKLNLATEHALTSVETNKQGVVWHRRLGHMGSGKMKKLTQTLKKELRDYNSNIRIRKKISTFSQSVSVDLPVIICLSSESWSDICKCQD